MSIDCSFPQLPTSWANSWTAQGRAGRLHDYYYMEVCSPGLNITQRQRLVTKQSLAFILVRDAHRAEVTHR